MPDQDQWEDSRQQEADPRAKDRPRRGSSAGPPAPQPGPTKPNTVAFIPTFVAPTKALSAAPPLLYCGTKVMPALSPKGDRHWALPKQEQTCGQRSAQVAFQRGGVWNGPGRPEQPPPHTHTHFSNSPEAQGSPNPNSDYRNLAWGVVVTR